MKTWILCGDKGVARFKGFCPYCGRKGQSSWIACPYCGERVEPKEHVREAKVVCVETGEVYDSVTECAEKMFTTVHSISACINGRQMSTCGYHFKKYEAI